MGFNADHEMIVRQVAWAVGRAHRRHDSNASLVVNSSLRIFC
jgi:hypothetical protein